MHHNTRAVYVKYLGFFDGNPSTLYPLPPTESATRYLDYMGGADEVVAKAEVSFSAGDYRWVAEVLNHVVMADPEHIEGRALLADTLEQLGYQSESAPWRNFYLCGALELREGLPESRAFNASGGIAAGMPIENFFQVLAVRLLPEAALNLELRIELVFTDLDCRYLLSIRNSVLNYFKDPANTEPQVSLTIASLDFKNLLMGATDAATLLGKDQMTIEGDATRLLSLRDLFDQFVRRYPLVTPRDQSQA